MKKYYQCQDCNEIEQHENKPPEFKCEYCDDGTMIEVEKSDIELARITEIIDATVEIEMLTKHIAFEEAPVNERNSLYHTICEHLNTIRSNMVPK